mgnify:CR=1 FL=1
MPELPEVQTVINDLFDCVISKKIDNLVELRKGTIINNTDNNSMNYGIIRTIERKGKYILIKTNHKKFLIHLRMTGKLIYCEKLDKNIKHNRAYFVFSDKTYLIFNDVRTFGKIEIYNENDEISIFKRLGIDALSSEMTVRYLTEMFKNRKAPIKNLLLSQEIISGIGNIYANEILFHARIDPRKTPKEFDKKILKKLTIKIKDILKKAIKHNGTTISDYRRVDDKTGSFQEFLKVYQKNYCDCGNKITKIKQAGRSTFYCSKCQK